MAGENAEVLGFSQSSVFAGIRLTYIRALQLNYTATEETKKNKN